MSEMLKREIEFVKTFRQICNEVKDVVSQCDYTPKDGEFEIIVGVKKTIPEHISYCTTEYIYRRIVETSWDHRWSHDVVRERYLVKGTIKL